MSDPFLEAALSTGRALAAAAEPAPDGLTWVGDEIVGRDGQETRILRQDVGPGLYGGAAGIGWFLAHLAKSAQDTALAATAASALGRAAARSRGELGLYSGRAGVALALIEGGEALARADLSEAGLAAMEAVAEEVSGSGPLAALDLIEGAAGVLIAILRAARARPGPRLEAAAGALAARLNAELGAARDAQGFDLCGLGHGASGLAWALLEAKWALGSPGEAAQTALAYERGWFDPERVAWADLRSEDGRRPSEPGWMSAWCHGALGIGAVRMRIWEATREPAALAEGSAAIHAARALTVGAGHALAAGRLPDVTLCHGLGGAAELLLLAYEATGDRDHLRAARNVGALALETGRRNGGAWTCGAAGASKVPGLFLGDAGVGATMLRLHDPRLIGSPALAGRPPLRS
jgi:lantibiotic modifying enzyme